MPIRDGPVPRRDQSPASTCAAAPVLKNAASASCEMPRCERLPELVGNAPVHAGSEPAHSPRGSAVDAGTDRRADRLGKGAGGRSAAPAVAAKPQAICGNQLRGHSRSAARSGALRPHPGSIYRRGAGTRGPHRVRRWRNAVSGRDRRDAAGPAVEAAALCGERRAAARGRQRNASRWTCASWPRRTGRWRSIRRMEGSAPTFTTGWRCF